MSKALRNKKPSQEQIKKGMDTFHKIRHLYQSNDYLIETMIRQNPSIMKKIVKEVGIKDFTWKGFIDWIEIINSSPDHRDTHFKFGANKVNYIRIYRQFNPGRGLYEAKQAVDEYMYENNYQNERTHRDEVREHEVRERREEVFNDGTLPW